MRNPESNEKRLSGDILEVQPAGEPPRHTTDEAHADLDVYRRLVPGIADFAIVMLDVDGVVTSWNAAAQRSKGYAANEIIGKHFACFYCLEDREAQLPRRNLELARTASSYETQGWRIRKDGSRFWAYVVIDAIYGDDGVLCGFAKVTRDCDKDRKLLESTLERERGFRLLVESVTNYAIFLLDPAGNISSWNIGARRMKGYAPAEIVGKSFSCFYAPEDRAAGVPSRGLRMALRTGRFETEGWRVRKDGQRFWAHVVIHPIYDDVGALYGFAKVTQDCTEQRATMNALADSNRNLDLALSNMLQGLCLFDRHARIVICNERFAEILSIPGHLVMPGTRLNTVLAKLSASVVSDGGAGVATTRILRRDLLQHHCPGSSPCISEWNRAGSVLSMTTRNLPDGGVVCTIEDITARRLADEKILYLAHYDELTGLRNRTSFQRCLERLLERPAGAGKIALLYLDLDRFKQVNDTLGHHVGDRLLEAVARRLSSVVSGHDELARLGGDEFAIMLCSSDRASDAQSLANACSRQVSRPFHIDAHVISIGVSIGIAWSTPGDTDANKLFSAADVALYRAKWDGRGCSRVFHAGMTDPLKARRDLEDDLRRALRLGALQVHYQPVIDAGTGIATACEALVRWVCDRRGNVPPSEFIPLAEERGLIEELGAWVLYRACEDAAGWPPQIRLNVNVSPVQLRNPALVEVVTDVLQRSGLPPSRLELEITEAALLSEAEAVHRLLEAILALGASIAMDDFGTGYSSLKLLHDFPFSRVKIDRAFIGSLGRNPKSLAIVRHISSLCKAMGIFCVAEGVETEAQLHVLAAEGCMELQGFLISRPMPAADFVRWLALRK